VAQTTFNRELGAAPAGITRFGQIRTEDGSNVTVNSYRTFAGDGSFPLSDVYKITYGSTGLVTYNLDAEAFAVSGITVIGADGTEKAALTNPKKTRRLATEVQFSVSSGEEGTLYVNRKGRSEAEYRVTITI
jgi:hypothetical protein